MATVGSGQLQSTALARLLQHHCQHVAPFLPTTLTLPSPAPRPCQRFLQGFSLFRVSAFAQSPVPVEWWLRALNSSQKLSLARFHPFPLPGASEGAEQETVPARGRKQRSEMWSCKSASSGYFWGQLCSQRCSGDSPALVAGDLAAGPPEVKRAVEIQDFCVFLCPALYDTLKGEEQQFSFSVCKF